MAADLAHVHCVRHRRGVHGISRVAHLLADSVLRQSEDQVNVGPDELDVRAQVLVHERAIVDEELEVQVRDVSTGVAHAGGVDDHPLPRLPKREVRALDGLDERLSLLEASLWRVADYGVALQPGDDQRRPGVVEEQVQEASETVLGVLELGLPEERRVSRNIGYVKEPFHRYGSHVLSPAASRRRD